MTDGHLDATVLAEYDEGLLAPSRAVEIEHHLEGCVNCSAIFGQLGELKTHLADEPREIAMPAAVAARLDSALAAERGPLDQEAAPERTAPVHPLRRRLPQVLAAAATVAAVAFAGYAVSTSGGNDSAENTTGAQGGSAEDDSARGDADTGEDLAAPETEQKAALSDQIQAIASEVAAGGAQSPSQLFAADCGAELAAELDRTLIGVAKTDVGTPGAVLVVVEGDQPGLAQGFVLPTCTAGPGEALTDVTVAVER